MRGSSGKIFLCVLLLSGVIFFSFKSASNLRAQDVPDLASPGVTADDINLDVNPEVPYPQEDVTATVSSNSINLDTATIGWYKDGKLSLVGIGKKQFSFKTGESGSKTNIYVKLVFPDKTVLEKGKVVSAGMVNLLWESTDSYTPPFYKGKALPAPEATIKVVAIPETLGDKNYIFNWSRNFKSARAADGYNGSTYIFKNNYIDSIEKISVSAHGYKKSVQGEGELSVSFVKPKILFYENHPLLGALYGNAFQKDITLSKDEMTVIAEPYFFSISNPNDSDLGYTWSLNDSEIDTPDPKNQLVIRRSGSAGGKSVITLALESASKLYDLAAAQLNITF
jgi:hypothetical protein